MDGEAPPEPSHPARLDVDHAARAQRKGAARILAGVYRFVEADRGTDPPLQRRVVHHVVPREGLLDHRQRVAVHLAEQARISEGVCAVGVHHQRQIGKARAHRHDQVPVVAGLDLDLHPPVAGGRFLHDPLQEGAGGGLESDRHARRDRPSPAAQRPVERNAFAPGVQLPHRHLEGRLGHLVATDAGERGQQRARMGDLEAEREGDEEVPQHVEDGLAGLGQVVRIGVGHALAVAGHPARGDADEEELLVGRRSEGRLERPPQREAQVSDLDALELQGERRASARDARAVQLRQEP